MSSIVLALAGSRAVNRLEELLLAEVEKRIEAGKLDPAWFPPKILTVGRLPELLYPVKRPVADDLVQQFTWIAALNKMQDAAPDVLARLIPQPPELEDFQPRAALAKMFARVHRELAGDGLDFENVAEQCRQFGIVEETRRWQTLAALQKIYLETLDELGFWDLQTARLYAIKEKEPKTERTIVLIGTVDMNIAQKKILQFVSDNVISLVFAPEEHREKFDAFGCLVPERWKDAAIPLQEEQTEVLATPADQSIALARWLCERLEDAESRKTVTPEDVIIGVPSEELLPFVQQQLRQAGAKTRAVIGTSIRQSAPWQFLEILLKLLESRRFADFADVLRHPHVEAFLSQKFKDRDFPPFPDSRELSKDFEEDESDSETEIDAGTLFFSRLLIEVDRYHTMFLPGSLDESWRTYVDPVHEKKVYDYQTVRAAWEELETLFRHLLRQERRPLSLLCEELGLILKTVFHPETLRAANAFTETLFDERSEHLKADHAIGEEKLDKTLNAVQEMLDRMAAVPEGLPTKMSATEMLELLLRELQATRISPAGEKDAIEILGWLDLPHDDAPIVAITSMNEGVVPSSLSADLFLPDRIRRELGIEDNERRLARDVYALSVILASRRTENVHLIAGRRTRDGDTLLPSRLLFACEPKTLAERVNRFFSVEEQALPVVFPGTLRSAQEAAFRVPAVSPSATEIYSMSITEFRDYLTCPYRYYLRHRLRLDELRDDEEELDARKFGNVLHEVLRRFGQGPCRHSINEEEIKSFLEEQLETHTGELYGEKPRAVIRIQIEQLRTRLRAFAKWQAGWSRSGYKIQYTELKLHAPNSAPSSETEGSPNIRSFLDLGDERRMYLRGVIDRIDVHPKTGHWVIFDYKSSDAAAKPNDVHLKRKGKDGSDPQWADLQLPLYMHIVRQSSRLTPNLKMLDCAYIALPKDVTKTGAMFFDSEPSLHDHALATAAEIARNVLAGKFSPPSQVPSVFHDPFAPICLEQQ